MRISWHLGLGLGHVESVDHYRGVLVPLQRAHLYSASARSGKTEFEPRKDEDSEDGEEPKLGQGESESQGMLQMDAAEYTVEGLRKEMREGRRGQWTTYESEFLSSFLSFVRELEWG